MAGKPLLILDTCVLLDIIRAAARDQIQHRYTDAFKGIRDALLSGEDRFQLMVPEIVVTEFERNVGKVVQDATDTLEQVFKNLKHASTTLTTLLGSNSLPLPSDTPASLIGRCKAVVLSVKDLALVAPLTPEDTHLAVARSMARRAPAQRGKDSLGDCLITEFSLRVARARIASDPASKVALVSSNTADYCEGRLLHSSLQAEFDVAGLAYCRNWAEAKAFAMHG